mgnify:CR=1 FL=1
MKSPIKQTLPCRLFIIRKSLFSALLLFISALLVGCQANNHYPNNNTVATNTVNYGQYYLALKSLTDNEIQSEIAQQQIKKSQGSIEAEINLILLYSLPNSPVHNAYSAKSQLNKQLKQHKNYQFSPSDQAFISLLKDQLNQQLFLFQKLINQELEQDNQSAMQRVKNKKQQNKIAKLELTVNQLTKQITQLKKIEKTISEHGQ